MSLNSDYKSNNVHPPLPPEEPPFSLEGEADDDTQQVAKRVFEQQRSGELDSFAEDFSQDDDAWSEIEPLVTSKKVVKLSKVAGISSGELGEPLQNNPEHTLAWRIYRSLILYLPGGLARAISRFAVHKDIMQISDMDARLIQKLPPKLLKKLSLEQISSLTQLNFDRLNTKQLFAIRHQLTKLLKEASSEEREEFLIDLQKKNEELFNALYPLVVNKTKEGFSFEELFAMHPTLERDEDGLEVTTLANEEETIYPFEEFKREAQTAAYTFNGFRIAPLNFDEPSIVDELESGNLKASLMNVKGLENAERTILMDSEIERSDFVLSRLYEATGRDSVLTSQIQNLIHRGCLPKILNVIEEKYSLKGNVVCDNHTHHHVDITPGGMVKVMIQNIVELRDFGSGVLLGYADVRAEVDLSVEDLLAERMDSTPLIFSISPVISSEMKVEELTEVKHPKRLGFSDMQVKLSNQLQDRYSDSLAIKYVAHRLNINYRKGRSDAAESIKLLLESDQAPSLEELRNLQTDNRFEIDVVNEILEIARLEENVGQLPAELAQQVFDAQDSLWNLEFPRIYYEVSFDNSKLSEVMIQQDEETIQDLLLDEVEQFRLHAEEGAPLEIEAIRENVIQRINEFVTRAEVGSVEESLNLAPLQLFKEQVFFGIKEALQHVSPKDRSAIFQKKVRKLKKEFELQELDKEEVYKDIFDLFLDEMLHKLTKEFEGNPSDNRIKEVLDKNFDIAKMAFYETEINFPDRALDYANALMDRFFQVEEAYNAPFEGENEQR